MSSAYLRRLTAFMLLAALGTFGACAKGNEGTSDGDDGDTSSDGAAGPGGGGGAGGAGTCTAGETEACYSGPDGTQDVGVCAAGTRTCDDDGTFGPCEGEVLPGEEDCAVADDEDCDGDAPLCPGSAIWAHGWGDDSTQQVTGVAVDADGNVVIVGYFSGSIQFGTESLTSAGGLDAFVAKFDESGDHLWSKRFGDTDEQYANGVAVDSLGDIYVAGEFKGKVNFGSGDLTASGTDLFLAKLSSASGNQVWSKKFGDSSTQAAEAVAVDGDDNVAITGSIDGTVDFGGGSLPSLGGGDIFVAKFAGAGNLLFAGRYGDSSGSQTGLALTSIGSDTVVTGSFIGTVNFGGMAINAAAGADIFVARLGPTGAHVWSKGFGLAGDQAVRGIASDTSANVVLAGSFQGSVTFGGSTLTSVGLDDVFVAKLDGAGAHVWSKQFGDDLSQIARGVAVDADGNVALTGGFGGDLAFGSQPLASAGVDDVFVARLDPSGKHLSSKSFGAVLDQIGRAIALSPEGELLVAGDYKGELDFGAGPLPSAGNNFNVFLAKFAP